MTDDAPRFLDPTEAEAFVLAEGVVGWVPAAELTALQATGRQLAAWKAEVDQLDAVRAAAVAEAREVAARGFEADWRTEIAALRAARTADRVRAAALAIELAEVLVGEHLAASTTALHAWLDRWTARVDRLRRVRAAPESVAAVAAWAGDRAPVVEDPGLAPGDVVIETDDGQVDLRVASLIEPARDDVLAELARGEGGRS